MRSPASSRLFLVSVCAMFLGGCDAHIRALGKVQTPDQQPVTTATVTVTGWTDRTVEVEKDGSFALSIVHGGRAVLRFSAPGFRPTQSVLKGTGHFRCIAVLEPETAERREQSRVDCKRD